MPTPSASRARRKEAGDGLFIVGLVGRTGSGKSTVAGALAQAGAAVIEGDVLGHEVTDSDPEVRAALTAEYGSDVYLGDGTLDRRRVAARVFADPEARRRLDRLVHPRIVELIRGRLERLRAQGFRGVVVIDAALLLDWRLERWCDAVIAVIASEEEQVGRLARWRGWSEAETRQRLAAQRSQQDFASAADVTLENRGSRPELERSARAAIARLAEDHATRAQLGGGRAGTRRKAC